MIERHRRVSFAWLRSYLLGSHDFSGKIRSLTPKIIHGEMDKTEQLVAALRLKTVDHVVLADLTPGSYRRMMDHDSGLQAEILRYLHFGQSLETFQTLIISHPSEDEHIDLHCVFVTYDLMFDRPFSFRNTKRGDLITRNTWTACLSRLYGLQDPQCPMRKRLHELIHISESSENAAFIEQLDKQIIEAIRQGKVTNHQDILSYLQAHKINPQYNNEKRHITCLGPSGLVRLTSTKYRGEKEYGWLARTCRAGLTQGPYNSPRP